MSQALKLGMMKNEIIYIDFFTIEMSVFLVRDYTPVHRNNVQCTETSDSNWALVHRAVGARIGEEAQGGTVVPFIF